MINVMIVDNESAIRKGMLHFIQWTSLGCEIAAQAGDGQAALDLIPAVKPDLIISDIRMPGMDGLELASRIYQEYPDIKVIILTGYPDFKYAQRAIQSHVVDFVLKPVSVENLTRAVEKAKAEIVASIAKEYEINESDIAIRHNYGNVFSTFNTPMAMKANTAKSERQTAIRSKIEDIIVTLELGGTKADLEKMLAEI